MERIKNLKPRNTKKAIKTSLSNFKRITGVFFFSTIIFLLLAFTTDIPWYLQTLELGLEFWDDVLINSVVSIYLAGIVSFSLAAIYSILSGIVLVNISIQLKNKNFVGRGFGAILPGFVATGCASCGIGVLGILGLTGAAASLPFNGDLFKVLGIILLIYSLHKLGDPEICEINS